MKHSHLARVLTVVFCLVFFGTALTACRIPQDDESANVLYTTYCEDSCGNNSVDIEAALTFYQDGSYRIGHVSGLVPGQPTSTYTYHYGTWKISGNTLSLYNSQGQLVGNSDGTVVDDQSTWGQWGVSNYKNADGSVTDYPSLYAFQETENGFILSLLDANYFYWGAAEHLESIYTSEFDTDAFLSAYNASFGTNLTSLSVQWGTAAPVEWYAWDSSNTVFADPNFQLPVFG